jgi:hypothetical protein
MSETACPSDASSAEAANLRAAEPCSPAAKVRAAAAEMPATATNMATTAAAEMASTTAATRHGELGAKIYNGAKCSTCRENSENLGSHSACSLVGASLPSFFIFNTISKRRVDVNQRPKDANITGSKDVSFHVPPREVLINRRPERV